MFNGKDQFFRQTSILGEWEEILYGKVIWTFVQMNVQDKHRIVLRCTKRDIFLELTKDSLKWGDSFDKIDNYLDGGTWQDDHMQVPKCKSFDFE